MKWKPSKSKAKEFAKAMQEIDTFCQENGIRQSNSSDSYYFSVKGQNYRVSNHTIEASNSKAYNFLGEQVREKYHSNNRDSSIIYITASKTRIIEIYNNILSGRKIDKRGRTL